MLKEVLTKGRFRFRVRLIGHVEGSLNQGAFSFQGAVDKACRRRLWSNWTKVL